ncbi:ROK family protein, partial [Thomasclavelia sp.]|uniref:ROK family protein n=1 Tax=Thomasclavelia sp. TaxID=3025757 RepID=UPI0025CF0B45
MEKKVLVIDVGGTFIKYGLINKKCQLTKKGKIKTPYESKEHFLKTLQNIYLSYNKDNIIGIALSVPGKIDVDRGIMITSGALVYLKGLELAKELSIRCD